MRRSTQEFIETALRSDKTVDNRLIGAAVDAAKGKTAAQYIQSNMDAVVSRAVAAQKLGCSVRTVDRLGKAKKIKRVKLTGNRRCHGYSLRSVEDYIGRTSA